MVKDYSLYIHIPFCRRKCDYCNFYVVPDKPEFHAPLLRALRQHWEIRCRDLPTPLSLYFGGGTPAQLGPTNLAEILSWGSLPIEITLEANPDSLTEEDLRAYRAIGINRLSLGVQSFDDALLRTLSRTHTAAKAIAVIETAARCGFSNISIDLMYDLPGQTLEIWKKTVEQACALPITHLSLYNLTIEPHTSFYKRRAQLCQPGPEISLPMLQWGEALCIQRGFERYEISAFARKGLRSLHNSGYWTDRPFIGLGPSAFSDWDQERFQNIPHFWKYIRSLEEGIEPISFRKKLPPHERECERIAIGLRMLEGVTIPAPSPCFSPLISEGFLEYAEDRIRLTPRGRLFYDTVCENLFCHF